MPLIACNFALHLYVFLCCVPSTALCAIRTANACPTLQSRALLLHRVPFCAPHACRTAVVSLHPHRISFSTLPLLCVARPSLHCTEPPLPVSSTALRTSPGIALLRAFVFIARLLHCITDTPMHRVPYKSHALHYLFFVTQAHVLCCCVLLAAACLALQMPSALYRYVPSTASAASPVMHYMLFAARGLRCF